jgi:hypothetical protein
MELFKLRDEWERMWRRGPLNRLDTNGGAEDTTG